MKTAKITAYKAGKPWNGANGTIYYHYITLDNGDTGSIGTKDQAGAKVQIGCELTYTIEMNESGNKIKAAKPEGTFNNNSQQNNNDSERQLMIVKQSSLKAAIDYSITWGAKDMTPEKITDLADYFTNWVMKG